jgi:hypothetical protein
MIQRSLVRSYTPNLFMLPMPCSFGGMNKPVVYIHCCALYLKIQCTWHMRCKVWGMCGLIDYYTNGFLGSLS